MIPVAEVYCDARVCAATQMATPPMSEFGALRLTTVPKHLLEQNIVVGCRLVTHDTRRRCCMLLNAIL